MPYVELRDVRIPLKIGGGNKDPLKNLEPQKFRPCAIKIFAIFHFSENFSTFLRTVVKAVGSKSPLRNQKIFVLFSLAPTRAYLSPVYVLATEYVQFILC